jgi:4-hydroxybenzoate polyprenyltransferase
MSKGIKKKGGCFSIREFWTFIRVETCLFITGMGTAGYLLFNQAGWLLLPLFLTVFFSTGAGYAYNHLTDRAEDEINNSRLNVFVTNGRGMPVVLSMFATAFFCSLFLPLFSFLLFILSIPIIAAYSALRMKEIFIAKNVYTGVMMAYALIIGASVSGTITSKTLYFFLAAFFFGFMGNLLGDIRGYKGDLASGVKTLPVKIGLKASARLYHAMMLGFSIYVLVSMNSLLYPLVPFGFLVSFFLAMDKQKTARYFLLSTFGMFSIFLLFGMMEGVS